MVVLTAAHCLQDQGTGLPFEAARVKVLTGRDTVSGHGGQLIAAAAVHVHKDYESRRIYPDVGVIVLAQPTSSPPIRTATTADEAAFHAGTVAALAGWGEWRDGQARQPDHLRAGDIRLRSNAYCASLLGRQFRRGFMLCADASPGRVGGCHGDSGGPLVVREATGELVLEGTTSWGRTPCASGPTVFARLSAVQQWLAAEIAAAQAPAA
jgi:secreted trypsin-like serine protease